MKKKVVCIHIGARAHYLLPKALESVGKLEALITDTWVSSGLLRSLLAKFPLRIIKSFSNRYTVQVPSNRVYSFSFRFLIIELYLRFKYKSDWSQIIKRNFYFQHLAINKFKAISADKSILGISYTSLDVFKVARSRNQRTILFQIDPGIKEEEIVADIVAKYGKVFTTTWIPAPADYWVTWKEECLLSDVVMVNSTWSKQGLIEQGIEEGKIKVLPLPFQIEAKHTNFKKEYPESFNKKRPLRCLFLGTLTLRKGIHIVLETASALKEYPIEFILVGQNELDTSLLQLPNVSYKGVASRSDTDMYYQMADVFLFPTLSDGFGLTQLESMSWQLPVIASTCCGQVVTDKVNGIELAECSVVKLKEALLYCLDSPSQIKQLSSNCLETVEKFSLENFAQGMLELI